MARALPGLAVRRLRFGRAPVTPGQR